MKAQVGLFLFFCLTACASKTTQTKATLPKTNVTASATWKPGSTPGILSDLEIFLRRTDITPILRAQAMFRLAALNDDQARAEADAKGTGPDLSKSIAIYQQILRDFPEGEDNPAIHYFLGHALANMNRGAEAQLVWRSLVCHNHYSYNAAKYEPVALPQDHDDAFWNAWETRHAIPIDQSLLTTTAPPIDETKFINPYAGDCLPFVTKKAAGAEPRYVAEVWWRLGEFHFEGLEDRGGPFHLNRAASAYERATHTENALVQGLAMYKLGWTHFKQQRYHAAVERFLDLLHHVDEQEKRTGDKGSNFRAEAITYIAASLTYVDFEGPGPDDPFVPRDDVLTTEKDPNRAEQKMHIAIVRVEDPKIIPQNEVWTPDIYEALATEYRELQQLQSSIEVSEHLLAKWPQYKNAASVKAGIEKLRQQQKLSASPPHP